jgi:predicted nucleotidyltransferase
MTARLKGRRRQASAVIGSVTVWAQEQGDVSGLLLVGSYAYGRPRMRSDVDLVLLTTEVQRHVKGLDWILAFDPAARVIRTQAWGPLTERRVRLRSGLHAELGVATPSWASLPLDRGTRNVLRDGCKILYDPRDLLREALDAL